MSAREPSDQRRALVVLEALVLGAIVVMGLLVAFAVVELPSNWPLGSVIRRQQVRSIRARLTMTAGHR